MDLNLDSIKDILFHSEKLNIDTHLPKVDECFAFLKEFSKGKIIYGINTGFGPMSQWRIDDAELKNLQYNIIRSHATGMGEPLPDIDVKASMIARLGCFIQGKSGIHRDALTLLQSFINNDIIPYVPKHGSVGASGDLVQLAHIALCLIGEGKVHYKGCWQNSCDVMKSLRLEPLKIYIREGLSITNGTSVMTGIGMVNQFYAENLLKHAITAAVWLNEIASSYDDWMSEPLNQYRNQSGQKEIARQMRKMAQDSKCLRKRELELYKESEHSSYFTHKVQAYYSLRCTPQILGPIHETLQHARTVLENELNAATDNPVVDSVTRNVYHGGNFHGDYISFEQDKVKIALVRLAMTAERQLNYLLHDRINGILPPFLNLGKLGVNYAMQACQFTATSTTAECQTLAMPNYVHSIPNNNDNQDIVSMGSNTAEICRQVVENTYQVMSVLFMALAQATDCLKISENLSSGTHKAYNDIRAIHDTIIDDKQLSDDLNKIEQYLKKSV